MIKKISIFILSLFFAFNAQAETKTAHIIVALCDNLHQGIHPVPYKLGKGNDPENNLYWGAMYGVKTYFKNSKDWILIKEIKDIDTKILRRVIFKHKNSDTWMVADAYLGKKIRTATKDFLNYSAGDKPQTIDVEYNNKKTSLNIGGSANLISYIGHNGLMDFSISQEYKSQNKNKRDVIILACYSKKYFTDFIRQTGANPILWTNGKLAPEAYILKAALNSWAGEESSAKVKENAAAAYAKYQKISNKAASNLFSN